MPLKTREIMTLIDSVTGEAPKRAATRDAALKRFERVAMGAGLPAEKLHWVTDAPTLADAMITLKKLMNEAAGAGEPEAGEAPQSDAEPVGEAHPASAERSPGLARLKANADAEALAADTVQRQEAALEAAASEREVKVIPFEAAAKRGAKSTDGYPAPKAAAETAHGKRRGKAPALAGHRLYQDTNGRREGTRAFKSAQIVIENPGILYEEFVERGGVASDLNWDFKKGLVRAEPCDEPAAAAGGAKASS